jgi:plastocyanin domain-containing protein
VDHQLVNRKKERAMRFPQYSEGHAWVRVSGAFEPARIAARPGERLRVVFRREETSPCSERVVFPGLGMSVMLPPFEDVDVDLGPLPEGEHEFTCGLGTLRGQVVVQAEPRHAQPEALGGRVIVRRVLAARSVPTTDPFSASTPDAGGGRRSYSLSESTRT